MDSALDIFPDAQRTGGELHPGLLGFPFQGAEPQPQQHGVPGGVARLRPGPLRPSRRLAEQGDALFADPLAETVGVISGRRRGGCGPAQKQKGQSGDPQPFQGIRRERAGLFLPIGTMRKADRKFDFCHADILRQACPNVNAGVVSGPGFLEINYSIMLSFPIFNLSLNVNHFIDHCFSLFFFFSPFFFFLLFSFSFSFFFFYLPLSSLFFSSFFFFFFFFFFFLQLIKKNYSISKSWWLARMLSPSCTPMALMTPDLGARISFSIFMASWISTMSFSSTRSWAWK